MKILLLGGTGAMGVHLSELLKKEHEVYVTSRSPGRRARRHKVYKR